MWKSLRRERRKRQRRSSPIATYQQLHITGELRARVGKAKSILQECRLCPRHCGANRMAGEAGKCHITSEVAVSSYGPHFGEEASLVGRHGSGTIFFTRGNLAPLKLILK